MVRISQFITSASVLALAAFAASPAHADGTLAGEIITNEVTANYNVGGVAQSQETASDTFYVDRKVNVVVATVGTSPNVPAGSTSVVREFSVTNSSNAAVGFALSVAQDAGAQYTISNVEIWVDANNNDLIDNGETAITFIDSIAVDDTQNVKVRFDVPIDASDAQTSQIILTANAVEPGTGGTTEIEASAGANTAGASSTDIETVLADGSGVTDAANEGDFSAAHSVEVEAAALTVTKTSTVISDPVNNTTDPKAIPGAVVEYCVVVANAGGAATAQGIVINDDFSSQSANITFAPDSYGTDGDVIVDGDAACSGGTPTDKGYDTSTTTVNQTLSDVPGGSATSLRFRVTIN